MFTVKKLKRVMAIEKLLISFGLNPEGSNLTTRVHKKPKKRRNNELHFNAQHYLKQF